MYKCVLREIRKLEGANRSPISIGLKILGIAQPGVTKTKIVYGANLNFKIVRYHLKRLEKVGLIECRPGLIKTTEKGRKVLECFSRLVTILR